MRSRCCRRCREVERFTNCARPQSPNSQCEGRRLMKRQLTLTFEPINEPALLARREMSSGSGAAVYFLGVVRGTEDRAAISAIEYEAFQQMAEHQFHLLFAAM